MSFLTLSSQENKDLANEWLFLSDDRFFYTLEGEGKYVGYPSVFFRTSLCNLTCKGFASKDSPNGCDSYISWSKKNRMTFEEIAVSMEQQGLHERLRSGALLKLTGGEPFIWQDKLIKLCRFLKQRWELSSIARKNCPEYGFLNIDFETNGTLQPREEWVTEFAATFTTSPKLASNGDAKEIRYKPEVLKWLAKNDACFKFVIQSDQDALDVMQQYVTDGIINVPMSQIWFMPCCGSQKELLEKGAAVAEIAKNFGVKFSNRMHLQLWDKALKV